MVILSDKSKKRKSDDIHAVDGDEERRKKRKRTSHSKKKKQGDVDSEVKPQKTDPVVSVGHDLNNIESTEDQSSENKLVSLQEAEKHGVKVDESRSAEHASDTLTMKKLKKAKRKEIRSPKSSTVPDKAVIENELSANSKIEDKDGKYPDPRKDSSLAESASKALTYVYERLSTRSEWKFNKARQNWIIRNVWDDKVIPELYFPSCLKYLKGVQGNSRNVLIKECNSIMEKHSLAAAEQSAKKENTVRFQEPQTAADDIKLLRAQLILKKLDKKKDKQ